MYVFERRMLIKNNLFLFSVSDFFCKGRVQMYGLGVGNFNKLSIRGVFFFSEFRRSSDVLDEFVWDHMYVLKDFRYRLGIVNNLDRIGRIFRGGPLTEEECVEFLSFFVCPDFVRDDRVFIKKFAFFLSFFDKDGYILYLFAGFTINDFYYYFRSSALGYVFLAWLALDYKSTFDKLYVQYGRSILFEQRIVDEARKYYEIVDERYCSENIDQREKELLLYTEGLFVKRGFFSLSEYREQLFGFLVVVEDSLWRVKSRVVNRNFDLVWFFTEEMPLVFVEVRGFFKSRISKEYYVGFFDENFIFYFYFIFSRLYKKMGKLFLSLSSLIKRDKRVIQLIFRKISVFFLDIVVGFLKKLVYFEYLQYFKVNKSLNFISKPKGGLVFPKTALSSSGFSAYETIFASSKILSTYVDCSYFFLEGFSEFMDVHRILLLVFKSSLDFGQKFFFFFVFRFSFLFNAVRHVNLFVSGTLLNYFRASLTEFSAKFFMTVDGFFLFRKPIDFTRFKRSFLLARYVVNYHRFKGLREFKYVPPDYRIMNEITDFMSLFDSDLMLTAKENISEHCNIHEEIVDVEEFMDDEEEELFSFFEFLADQTDEEEDPYMSCFSVLDFRYFLNERDHLFSPGVVNDGGSFLESGKGNLVVSQALSKLFIEKFMKKSDALLLAGKEARELLASFKFALYNLERKTLQDFCSLYPNVDVRDVYNNNVEEIETEKERPDDFLVAYVKYVKAQRDFCVMTFEDFLETNYYCRLREIELFTDLEEAKWSFFWPMCIAESFGKRPKAPIGSAVIKGVNKFYIFLLKISAFLFEEPLSIYERGFSFYDYELRWDVAFDRSMEKVIGIDSFIHNAGDFSGLTQCGEFGDVVLGYNEVELYRLRRVYEFSFLLNRGNPMYKSFYQRRFLRRYMERYGKKGSVRKMKKDDLHSYGRPKLRYFKDQFKSGFLPAGYFRHNFHFVGLNEFEGAFSAIYKRLFFFGKKLAWHDDSDMASGVLRSFYNRGYFGDDSKGDDSLVGPHEDPGNRQTGLLYVEEDFDGLNFMNFYNFWWNQCLSEDLNSFYDRQKGLAVSGVFSSFVRTFEGIYKKIVNGLYVDRGFLLSFYEEDLRHESLDFLVPSILHLKNVKKDFKYNSCFVVINNFFRLLFLDKLCIDKSFLQREGTFYELRILLSFSLLKGLECLRQQGVDKFRFYYKFFLVSFVLFFWFFLAKILGDFVVSKDKLSIKEMMLRLSCFSVDVRNKFFERMIKEISFYLCRFKLIINSITYRKLFFFYYKGCFKLVSMDVFLEVRELFFISPVMTVNQGGLSAEVEKVFGLSSEVESKVAREFSNDNKVDFKGYVSNLNYFVAQEGESYVRSLNNKEFLLWLARGKEEGNFDSEGFRFFYKLRSYLFAQDVRGRALKREKMSFPEEEAPPLGQGLENSKVPFLSSLGLIEYGAEFKSDFNYMDYENKDLYREARDASVYGSFTGWEDGNMFMEGDNEDGILESEESVTYEEVEIEFFDTFLFSDGTFVRDFENVGGYEDYVDEIDGIKCYPISEYVATMDANPDVKVIYPKAYRFINYCIYVLNAFYFGGLNDKFLMFYKQNIEEVLESSKITDGLIKPEERVFFNKEDFDSFYENSRSLAVGVIDQVYDLHFYADLDFLASPFSLLIEYGVPYERKFEYLGFSKELLDFSDRSLSSVYNKKLILQHDISLYFVERLKLRLSKRIVDEFNMYVKDSDFYDDDIMWKMKLDYLFRKFFSWLMAYQLGVFSRVNINQRLLLLVYKLVLAYVVWQRKARNLFFEFKDGVVIEDAWFFKDICVKSYFVGFAESKSFIKIYNTFKNCDFLDLLREEGGFAHLLPFEFVQKLRRFLLLFKFFGAELNFYSLIYLEEEVDLFVLQFPLVSNKRLWQFVLEIRSRLKKEEFIFFKNYYGLCQISAKYGLKEALYCYESKLRYEELQAMRPWYFSLSTFIKEVFFFFLVILILFLVGTEQGIYFFDYFYLDYYIPNPSAENDTWVFLHSNTGGKRMLGNGSYYPY